MMRYSVLRLLVFFAFLLGLWLVGLRGIWLIVFAGLFSLVTSYFLLQGPRAQFSRQIEEKVERRQAKVARERTDEEDEDRPDASGPHPHT